MSKKKVNFIIKEEKDNSSNSKSFINSIKPCYYCSTEGNKKSAQFICDGCGYFVCEKCSMPSQRTFKKDDNIMGTYNIHICFTCLDEPHNKY